MRSKEDAKPTAMLPVPDLSLPSTAAKDAALPVSAMAHVHSDRYSGTKRLGGVPLATAGSHRSLQLQQPPTKTRRCWSPELHRLFVLALEQLGGAQVATPKQIRELMKVDGLSNDQVKAICRNINCTQERSPMVQQLPIDLLWSLKPSPSMAARKMMESLRASTGDLEQYL
ncbi:transcription factor NIGTH1-like isoform X2 [Zingiber officinale]|uniref:transcription factor NIGTH1-like isoform X2 n=1 Tax=Zingiber officinale TaxID=94328 RepID=UPI001C4C4F39|nr:transcription factor NIGTH1-like isoform X2 [Zingiber officinale]XP_042416476.1 transcription factor NIGTH1-like isoform X2 [Zingiber officinale]